MSGVADSAQPKPLAESAALGTIAIAARDGTRITARVSGSLSQCVCLLIHGSADGAYVWDDLYPTIEPVCSIVAPDLRGHGNSGRALADGYALSTYVGDMESLITELS